MEQFKIDQLEANLERFKIDHAAINSEQTKQCLSCKQRCDKNKDHIGEGDQSRVPEKNVPSHVPRKQQLGGLIFDAEVEIPVGFDLRTFEGLHLAKGGYTKEEQNPGIILSSIKKKHFEWVDK
ncbi:hypothetical protein Tco_0631524 [Tanacetum coccineum]